MARENGCGQEGTQYILGMEYKVHAHIQALEEEDASFCGSVTEKNEWILDALLILSS